MDVPLQRCVADDRVVFDVDQHRRHRGVFIARGRSDPSDFICTVSLTPGVQVFGERVLNQVTASENSDTGEGNVRSSDVQVFRTWNPFECFLAASIVGGIESIPVAPGNKVICLHGSTTGQTLSYVSDIVGEAGIVFAVAHLPSSVNAVHDLARERQNIVPISADPSNPDSYESHVVAEVDGIFCALPDSKRQVSVLGENLRFLRPGGLVMIAVDASKQAVEEGIEAAEVFAKEVTKLRDAGLRPREQLTMEPFFRDCAVIVAMKPTAKA